MVNKIKKHDRIIKVKAYDLVSMLKKMKYLKGFGGQVNFYFIQNTLKQLGLTNDEITQVF